MKPSTGTLWIVPNTLDLGALHAPPIEQLLPPAVLARAAQLTHWAAEDAKVARAFLKRVHAVVPAGRPLQDIAIAELPRPPKGAQGRESSSDTAAWHALLEPLRAGHDLGLVSDAGLPAVADPGARLVAAAHAAGVAVQPLPGASSITLALAASGLHGQSFAFVGYLPTDAGARATRVRELEAASRRHVQTQIAIETPYRNAALATALLELLQPMSRLSIACGLTLPGGWCATRTVQGWRNAPPAFADKHLPAVFLWLAD
jgi:16S rRNA (cytidine1402-2'-O)-methyltransferase